MRRTPRQPKQQTPPPSGERSHVRALLRRATIMLAVLGALCLLLPAGAYAADAQGENNGLVELALYLGALTLLPFAVMTLTSFLRIVIVLSFLRSGLGAQNVPPNVVIIGLALFLSLFVMGPTVDAITQKAQPAFEAGDTTEAMSIATDELKVFMGQQIGTSGKEEVEYFYTLALKQGYEECDGPTEVEAGKNSNGETCIIAKDDMKKALKEDAAAAYTQLPAKVLIPAFIVSELEKAFIMGFAILLPFLVIDMVISNVLLSLGMFMLPPVVISLPFKVLLFVLAGGWTLTIDTLVTGFNYS